MMWERSGQTHWFTPSTSPVASGARSLAVTFQAWGGVYFRRTAGPFLVATGVRTDVTGESVTVGPGFYNRWMTPLGMALFGPYALGVELASMLLLAGLVGAYHLGRKENNDR